MWKKLNDEPIRIEEVVDEHNENLDFTPSFWFNNKRYYLKDFIKCHNNPWIGTTYNDPYPEYIHGYEADNYYNPLFIEVNDPMVNVYEEVNNEEEK